MEKNNRIGYSMPYSNNLSLAMKLTTILLILSIFTVQANSYSQKTKVTLDLKQVSMQKVFEEIESLTDFKFLYDNKKIDGEKLVTVKANNKPISDVLDNLFKGTSVYYLLRNKQIVLKVKNTPIPSKNKEESKLIEEDKLAQQVISGIITDDNGQPLPGANVVEKGTTNGVTADFDGNFTITLTNESPILVISYVGFSTQEIAVNGQTNLSISLTEDAADLEEVVVVGYGTMKKGDLTGSVEQVNPQTYQNQSLTTFLDMLNGTVAGFNSIQGTTAAGNDGYTEIRGATSLKANNSPLVVLDGVIYNGRIEDINPTDIESISVLKDASSSAIYGARSAAGVVIVTTKRGTSRAPTVNLTAKVGVVGLTNIMRPLDPEEYLNSRGEYLSQVNSSKQEYYYTNPDRLPSSVSLDEWMNYDAVPSDDPTDMWLNRLTLAGNEKNNYLSGKTVNWYDEVLQNGIRQDYDISLSGGLENLKYYWSAGYTDNNGYILGDRFKTFRSRINLDANISNFLKVQVNAQYADRNNGFQKASLYDAYRGSPWGDIYNEDGSYKWFINEESVAHNPLQYYGSRDLFDKTQSLFASLSGELILPYGFSYSISFVNRYSWRRNYLFDPLETENGFVNNGYGSRSNNTIYEWQIDNLIKWNRIIDGIHDFDITFLINAEKYQSWDDQLTNSQFLPTDALSFHNMAAGISPSVNSNDEYSTGNALMARINYTLLNKYLLTLTARRDGYSAFGQSNPYAYFPSAAGAWRISQEKFFNVKWIDNLKLRLSWGMNGNRDIGRYDALARLSTTKYNYGNTEAAGVYSSTMANRDLKWEKTQAFNLGLDFGFFQNQLSSTIDVYSMTTKDLLMDRSLPNILGYSSVASNLGELENKGLELTINSKNLEIPGKINWNSSLVFSFNRNKIKHLYGDIVDVLDESGNVIGQKEADDWTNGWFIGQSIDRIWDYDILGVWQLEESEQAAVYGRRPGDMKLRDVNGDGVLNPEDDKIFQGFKTPQYRLGFRNDFTFLKNFNLSTFIRADLGYYAINNLDEETSWIGRINILHAPYWTPENPSNEYAMLNTEKDAPYKVWKNSSFIRLQDVSLSYNVPNNIASDFNIQSARFFLSLRNYFTITKWNHWDPESGIDPMPKFMTAGIDLKF